MLYFFLCLKIAVNYKCSLNVSSDPEMQVGMRQIACLLENRCAFQSTPVCGVASSWVASVKYSAGLMFAIKSYALEQRTEKWNYFFHASFRPVIALSATVVLVWLDSRTMSLSSKDDRVIV